MVVVDNDAQFIADPASVRCKLPRGKCGVCDSLELYYIHLKAKEERMSAISKVKGAKKAAAKKERAEQPKAAPKVDVSTPKKRAHAETMLKNLEVQEVQASTNPQDTVIRIPVAPLAAIPTDAVIPDTSELLAPYEDKPKELPDYRSMPTLAESPDFVSAAIRINQLSIQKAAIEEAISQFKVEVMAGLAIAGVDAVAVGRLKVQIVKSSRPSLKKELLLQNGVTVEQIAKSTVYTPSEYPLVRDMSKPAKGHPPNQEE